MRVNRRGPELSELVSLSSTLLPLNQTTWVGLFLGDPQEN